MTRYFQFLALPSLALFLLFLSACQVDAEKSPAFATLQAQFKKLETAQAKNEKSVSDLRTDYELHDGDIKKLNAKVGAAGPSADVTALVERINKLEQQVKELSESKKAAPAEAAPIVKVDGGATTSAPRPAATPKVAKTPKGAKPAAAVAADGSVAKPEASAKKGAYYKVNQGDTVQSIAQANGVSVGDLCKANPPMKAESSLLPGQSIYIPAK